MAEKSSSIPSMHPATTITNIKTHIPLVLDYENAQYHNWATLFTIHTKSTLTYEHICPKQSDDVPPPPPPKSAVDQAQWDRIDNIVRQWIYGTISNDLLNTIINPDDSALDAWNHLADLFQDNKTARAIHLETEFANTHLRDFPDTKAYTRRLKVLADQMANVGAKVSDQRLVLRLLTGLTDAYDGFVTVIQNKTPLPTFAQVRSMLLLDETTKAERAKIDAASSTAAMVVKTTSEVPSTPQQATIQSWDSAKPSTKNQRRQNTRQRGRGNNSGGRGYSGGRGSSNGRGYNQSTWNYQNYPPWGSWQPYYSNHTPQWAIPPCPYPTWSAPPQSKMARQQGILGLRPS